MIRKMLFALALCLAVAIPAFAASPVNINTADARTIATALDGIGLGKAAAIVAYRDAHGPFKNVAEVGKVKGIGAKTLARNQASIHLDGDFPAPTKAGRKTKHAKPHQKA